MADRKAAKKTHFGRAGEYFAMSELLLRGWNVAVPVVDIGDDVFVIDDHIKMTWRIQVKSATVEHARPTSDATQRSPLIATFNLSRAQLSAPQPIELFYMFLLRVETTWRFLVIPRGDLLSIRQAYEDRASSQSHHQGRLAISEDRTRNSGLSLKIVLSQETEESWVVSGWGASLAGYLDQWPDALRPVEGGPGTVGRRNASLANPESPPVDPDPSPDPET